MANPIFGTGQGDVIGNASAPVLKICANPTTVGAMSEQVDLDISGLPGREYRLEQAEERILALLARTASGRFTAAEALGQREFVLTKLHRSA